MSRVFNPREMPLHQALLLAALIASQVPGQLRILDAVYGDPEHARWCDATLAVGQQCDDRSSCLVSVGPCICGDPDYGTLKHLYITFKCGPGPAQTLAVAEAGTVRIACAPTSGRPTT